MTLVNASVWLEITLELAVTIRPRTLYMYTISIQPLRFPQLDNYSFSWQVSNDRIRTRWKTLWETFLRRRKCCGCSRCPDRQSEKTSSKGFKANWHTLANVHKIARNFLHLFRYKISVIHELKNHDCELRMIFYDWLTAVNEDNPSFLNTCFWSGEAWFHLSGYMTSQNSRCWSSDNPHQFTETSLHPQKVGAWACMSG